MLELQLVPVVMAGDTEKLLLKVASSLTDDVVWMNLAQDHKFDRASDIINASGGSKATVGLYGLNSELVVQDEIQRSQGVLRSGLLSGQTKSERIIGYGPTVSWTPQYESPDLQIVVLARNQNGLWGIAKRSTPVMDLRPAIWAKPLVNVEVESGSDFGAAEGPWTLVKHVHSVQNLLSRLSFQATAGQQILIDLRSTPFSEAHAHADGSVAYGDGRSSFVAVQCHPIATCMEDAWSLWLLLRRRA